ncbi:hypothetical protein HK096_006115, partial [Nowakowskiella sp. JEL0078]
IGAVDGTHIHFAKQPGIDRDVFLTRKQYSTHDSEVYKSSNVYKNSSQHFSPGEYLLADSAYPLLQFYIVPYKGAAAKVDENIFFNENHSALLPGLLLNM